jgi:hypothetical protein
MKSLFLFSLVAVTVWGCGSTEGAPIAGSDDALAQEACAEAEHDGEAVHSVLDRDEAIEHALVHAGEPVTIELAGPTSYVALEVPHHHTDYGVFTRPAGVLRATSTTTLSEEAINGACPSESLGDNRVHIHEFDHSVLTLEGSGTVWLYFAQHGGSGHDDHDGGTEHHE